MNLDGDASTDEYIVTAIQIFDYCGVDSTGSLRVDVLMDKFAPFVKNNKAEFASKVAELKSLLDPDECNPEITVNKLAMFLHKYSDSQRIKVDLEESFNLKGEQAPHDSDSGISTDGLVEELQCELREKCHQAHRLRSQLDFTDRQHEEALAALAAERDALRAHLNVLREENTALSRCRLDYEEASERLCTCERALDDATRELDATRRRARSLHDANAELEAERSSLQEQLARSTGECHRINEMYLGRQAALRRENEALRAERAELAALLHEHAETARRLLKDKVLLEMELKDLLNRSCPPHARPADRSADASYTEEQMLSELDSMNAESRFVHEQHLLDEESFINGLQDDQGRSTNISLFNELRHSICSRLTVATVATQTYKGYEENEFNDSTDKVENIYGPCLKCQTSKTLTSVGSQTYCTDDKVEQNLSVNNIKFCNVNGSKSTGTQYDCCNNEAYTQTDVNDSEFENNNSILNCIDCSKCMECERLKMYSLKLERDIKHTHETMCNMQLELVTYEDNLNLLKRFVDEGNSRNKLMEEFVDGLKSKLVALECACEKQHHTIQRMTCDKSSMLVQTDFEQSSVSTQAELPCTECVSSKAATNSTLKKCLWEPLRCLFQLLAVMCFACALWALYAATGARGGAGGAACRRRGLGARDLLDLFLSVEYGADVPMCHEC